MTLGNKCWPVLNLRTVETVFITEYLFILIILIYLSHCQFWYNVQCKDYFTVHYSLQNIFLCDLLSRGHFKIALIFDFIIEAVFYYISSIQTIPYREPRYNGSFKEIYIYGAQKFGLQKYQIPKELKSSKFYIEYVI